MREDQPSAALPMSADLGRDADPPGVKHDPSTGQFVAGSGVTAETHKHLTGKGLKPYSHGPTHQGYSDPSGSKMTVQEAHGHITGKGYKPAHNVHSGQPVQGQRNFAGLSDWAYEKSGGPYRTQNAGFSSKNDTHVHSLEFSSQRHD